MHMWSAFASEPHKFYRIFAIYVISTIDSFYKYPLFVDAPVSGLDLRIMDFTCYFERPLFAINTVK